MVLIIISFGFVKYFVPKLSIFLVFRRAGRRKSRRTSSVRTKRGSPSAAGLREPWASSSPPRGGGGELPTSRAMSKCSVFSRGRMRFDLCIPPLISVFRPVFRDSGTCGRRGSLCFPHSVANCDIRVETNAVRGITKPEDAKNKVSP